MKLRSIAMVTVCVLVLSLPMLLLLISGEAEHDLEGEQDYQRPQFSVGAFLDGRYQQAFENWFSTKYPLRPEIVALYGIIDASKDNIRLYKPNLQEHALFQPVVSDIEPRFGEYALPLEQLAEPGGYLGTAHVVIGKNGCLFENGYINEYVGYSPRYTNITDAALLARAETLRVIQDKLAERGIAFCVAITPSKASSLPQYIPAWYTAKYTEAEGYVRPYSRFVTMLQSAGVIFIDSAAVYRSVGLTNTFPKTGTHWTKMAAFETSVAIIGEYERQTGTTTRSIAANRILNGSDPPGFGTDERDIFGIAYAGKRNELENALKDDAYYWPDTLQVNADASAIPHVLLQGGSFTDDIQYYLTTYGIADNVTNIRYNQSGNPDNVDWEALIEGADFVVLEVNEQFVHNMGGNAPSWGNGDFLQKAGDKNIVDALYAYLVR